MKDQQPTSIRGVFPVGGRLFCWLYEAVANHTGRGRYPVGFSLCPARCIQGALKLQVSPI